MQDVLREMGSHLRELHMVCVGIMIVSVMSCILSVLIPTMILLVREFIGVENETHKCQSKGIWLVTGRMGTSPQASHFLMDACLL